MYTVLPTGTLLRDDGMYIPQDSSNRHYKEYLAWVEKGNTAKVPRKLDASDNLFGDDKWQF